MCYLIEVVKLVGIMVSEFGENAVFVCCVGFFYDIGKVIDCEVEGSYVEIGMELVCKYKEYLVVVNIIVSYYGDVEVESVIVVIVAAVDVLSAVCLGVCSEFFESYIKCFYDLEEIVNGFEGV